MEGNEQRPDAAFVIEFTDRTLAKIFWNSSAFQELAILRRTGSTLNAILVEKLT